ncbi:NAD(P)-dependent oxidoreductase [uncultured Ilyobacter sp.]|uniref:NAD-dependent epimerase/dehydratase family protein n=1 Tax=uncultured Ilyobacter sp. TaxID=544433 RepID=UPI0029C98CFD|nr:NAD(P)-dependent oxidoreductase [uncultured Ilyobacter sp.]
MKVAITGGTGFLGRELVKFLIKNGNFVPITIGRRSISENEKSEYRKTDYTQESLEIVLRDIDAVIHLAAIRGADGKISDFHENETITENLYESCVNLGIKNIVFASSISVYSDTTKIPWKEEQVPRPKTLYGISKIACEYLGEVYHRKYGLNVKCLRIAHILGEHEKKGYMMNTFIDNAFERKTLKVSGRSLAKREFVYIKDVIKAIYTAVSKPKIHGVFNIGSNEAHTNLEIAEIVNECFDNKKNMIYDNLREEGIESSLMDSSKAKRELDYISEFSLEEALRDIKKIKLEGANDV